MNISSIPVYIIERAVGAKVVYFEIVSSYNGDDIFEEINFVHTRPNSDSSNEYWIIPVAKVKEELLDKMTEIEKLLYC